MRKNILILSLIAIVFSNYCFGQFEGGYSSKLWKTYRFDMIFGAGTCFYMGDIGGGPGEAAHFMGVKDFQFKTTRPTLTLGARYKILERLAVRTGFTYARLAADDKNSKETNRQRRNMNFKTNVYELALQLEYSFIKENRGKRYIFQKNSIINNINLYAFLGVAGFHFNPKAELNGTTYKLQELSTGGQGMTFTDTITGFSYTGDSPYKLYQLSFPMGLGVKYYLSKHWSLGAELGVRYTTTDYLDDASGRYFDNATIVANKGAIAGQLADPHITWSGSDGSNYPGIDDPAYTPYTNNWIQRGDKKYNDAYLFSIITLTYTFTTRARSEFKFAMVQE